MSGPRTLRLTEYRPREVRLRRADVDALRAHPRRPIGVVPTRQSRRYRLTAKGFAGVLHTPNLRIVLRPKVPAANLYMLLDPRRPPTCISRWRTRPAWVARTCVSSIPAGAIKRGSTS